MLLAAGASSDVQVTKFLGVLPASPLEQEIILDATGRLATMTENVEILSDRELETLRLLGQGHETKSIASALDVSVHTVNERLRAARRKLGTSSSREAARLLLAHEAHSQPSDNYGDKKIGVALAASDESDLGDAHSGATGARRPGTWIMIGVAMFVVLISVLVATHAVNGPAAASRGARGAEPINPIPWLFTALDYPAEAVAHHAQGITDFRLQVGENGRVRNCHVERSSGSKALDQATCRVIITRARFRPATNAAGRAEASVYTGMVHWLL